MSECQSKLLDIYDAFLLEFSDVSGQIKELVEAVSAYVNDCITIKNTQNLQPDIERLQRECVLLENFRCETKLNVDDIIEEMAKMENTELSVEQFNKILPYEHYSKIFTYPTIDPFKFDIGFEAKFAVTYIKDSVERLFFIIETPFPDILIKQLDFRYNDIPAEGIIFGILLDGCIIRAVRENQLQSESFESPILNMKLLDVDRGSEDDEESWKASDLSTNSCKSEDATSSKDGWRMVESILKVKIDSVFPLPSVGKKIKILVSHVVDVDKFYVQAVPKNYKLTKELKVEKIEKEMNNQKMKSKFKPLMQAPVKFELVFALYTDKLWYRARILQQLPDAHYEVFYVDYGNCSSVPLNCLRKWDDAFDGYPFQALECRLDNISKRRDNDIEAITYLESLVLDKVVEANVTYNVHHLHVTLQDVKHRDIGKHLCDLEYAKQKPITGTIWLDE